MRIEFHNGFMQPTSVEVTRVVVYDMHDNPVSLAVEVDDGVIIASTADHPDFNSLLRSMGIDKTVIVHNTPQIALPEIRFGK